MIKLLVSDIDGTLLHNGKINPTDIDALHKAHEAGIIICFASGRLDYEISDLLGPLVNAPFHRISQNGAIIYSHDEQELHKTQIRKEILHRLYDETKSRKWHRYIADEHKYYIEKRPFLLRLLEWRVKMQSLKHPTLKESLGESIFPVKFTMIGRRDDLIDAQIDLREKYGEYIDTVISAPSCLDIIPKNISKGSSIQKLMESLDIKANEMACVGDSLNDVSMLQMTEHSFAMANGEDQVKETATYTVNSVAEAVDKILELNK